MVNRLPRKVKKKIPVGVYCYTPVRYDHKTNIYHVKPCPFYTHKWVIDIENEGLDTTLYFDKKPELKTESWLVGWCKLIKHEIDDQCKSCGEKYDFKKHRNKKQTYFKRFVTKHKWKY